MPTGIIFLAQLVAKVPMLEFECNRCGRHGRVRTARLLTEHGPDMSLPELLRVLSANCPRRTAGRIFNVCGIYCPQFGRASRFCRP